MTNPSRLATMVTMAATLLLSGCASGGRTATTLYDFGPLPQTSAATAPAPLPALIVADVDGPPALDSERMQYRLLYADAHQARPYAYNQWTSTPPQLLTQRIKARLAQAGVKVLTSTDVGSGAPMLRLELDDFAQNFTSATQSSGALAVRASLFRNHRLVDQRTFQRSSPAPSADAAGGAHALADASDALTADLLTWLATLPQQ
ncbi:ABC-type transport auxiliary lipoprotein family protein [Rugamonas apoptosis]|uniref:Membrane integrity-associated transporter subunit PqiC n=1 Tax=Rugamonas apoptosis TaxID=2758570 RepID=A0A7W2IJD6_9BURK|nr:ABC-type transport auxiliary lipoprotein family protein [Rugamonas apoptosis]MBA5686146.1 membrane integrity-associated transporter subunit PqiC [Rugamonas apoptosis]